MRSSSVVLAHQPFVEVQARGATNGDGITIEEIGDQDQVAIGSKLVGDQLSILEPVPRISVSLFCGQFRLSNCYHCNEVGQTE